MIGRNVKGQFVKGRKSTYDMLGKKHSETTKQKISKALKGKKNRMWGKKHSKETREKMSEKHKGKKLSKETKEKMRLKMLKNPIKFWLGKKMSQETKNKMSKARMGNQYAKGRRKQNPISTYERKLWLNNKRRAKKFNNGGCHTLGEWETLKAQYNWTCPCCKKCEPKIKLTRDHIIPLFKGGSDNIENIQPLCRSCNSIKNIKIIKYEF